MKKLILILFLFTGFLQAQTLQSPEYKNVTISKRPVINSGTALVAPYFSSITGGITYSNDLGTTEAIMLSYQFRIRQDGTVKAVELYTANKINLTTFKIRVYRSNGSNYDLIGESEDISASLSNSGSSLVTLQKPILGVQQGDYYGFISTQSGAWDGLRVFDSATESLTNTFIRKSTNSGTFSNTSQALSMRIFMNKPSIIFLGSSITEGLNSNQSFLHSDGTLFNRSVYWGDMLSNKLGFKYQNMGIGGSTSAMILSRINSDVISNNPNYVTIQGTVNDIIAGTSTATVIANFDAIISACVTSGIKPIVLPILPYNGDTNANYQKRDAINAGIKASALSRGAIFIDGMDQALGVFKVGGDVGNLWNLNPLYNTDAYHLNLAGNIVLTNTIYDAIKSSVLSGALISGSVITDNLTVKNLENNNGVDQYYPLANSEGSLLKGSISKSALETTKFSGSYNFRINNNTTVSDLGNALPGVALNYAGNFSIHPAGYPAETPLANTGFRLLYTLSDAAYRSAISIDNLPTSNSGKLRLMEREGVVQIGLTSTLSTNNSERLITGSSTTLGATAGFYSYNTEIRQNTGGNNARFMTAGYRRAAGSGFQGTGFRLQYAVDSAFTDGSKAFVEIGASDPLTSGGGFISFGTNGLDRFGIYNDGSLGINLSPTVSSGGYEFLTRNTTSGKIEKIPSSSVIIPQLEFNNTDLTVWNNGKGNVTQNTSFGDQALKANTTGGNNTAYGYQSLSSVTTGSGCTALGFQALSASNAQGNTAVGFVSQTNATGGNNTSIGYNSLKGVGSGSGNIGVGQSTMELGNGSDNVVIGRNSGNTYTGSNPLTGLNNSVFIGANTSAKANNSSNEIVIGDSVIGNGNNTVTIGNSSILNNYFSGSVNAATFNGVKVYNALITQTSTGAPTVTILGGNSIGSIVWTRTTTGSYVGTLSGAFTASKTACMINNTIMGSIQLQQATANTVTLTTADSTGTLLDGRLTANTISISVYP